MTVQELNKNHVEQVVKLHKQAFVGFFLTELGTSFLNQYYRSVIASSKAVNVGVFDQANALLGFAVTSKKSKGFSKKLIAGNFLGFFFEGLRLIFTRPKALIRLIKNLEKKSDGIVTDTGNYSELLSIATDPSKQGLGVGKLLLVETEKILKEQNFPKLALTTDFDDNQPVIRFYQKNGYSIYYDFKTYPNRKMYKLIKDL